MPNALLSLEPCLISPRSLTLILPQKYCLNTNSGARLMYSRHHYSCVLITIIHWGLCDINNFEVESPPFMNIYMVSHTCSHDQHHNLHMDNSPATWTTQQIISQEAFQRQAVQGQNTNVETLQPQLVKIKHIFGSTTEDISCACMIFKYVCPNGW